MPSLFDTLWACLAWRLRLLHCSTFVGSAAVEAALLAIPAQRKQPEDDGMELAPGDSSSTPRRERPGMLFDR